MDINHANFCVTPKVEVIKSNVSATIYYYCSSCFATNIKNSQDCCFKPNLEYCRFEMKNSRIQLRKYCISCGEVGAENFKQSSISDILKLPIVKKNELRWQEQHKESVVFNEWAKRNQSTLFFKEHNEYLKSSKWKQIRQLVLQRDNHICQGCLIVRASQVHHITYERWKNEMAFDLISLCSSCHSKIHE